jgi:hypothetical protein
MPIPLCINPASTFRLVNNEVFLAEARLFAASPTPNLEDLLVWVIITFDISRTADPTSSYATAHVALRII